MFIKTQPLGVNAAHEDDRMPIWKVVSGDDWMLTTRLAVPGQAGLAATPKSSKVVFTLTETRFSATPLWTGQWDSGISEADPVNHPGLVAIRIPDTVTATLRRGAYAFSITVSDKFSRNTRTVLTGTLEVEYEPTSPQHDIPYRSDD